MVLAYKRIEVGHVMAGLVAMCILTDQAGNVGLVSSGCLAVRGKHGIQQVRIGFGAAHQFDVAIDIVWHKEIVLPAIGFGVIEIDLFRIKLFQPCCAPLGLKKSGFRVEEVSVVQGTKPESLSCS